jgi:hypothetical protein
MADDCQFAVDRVGSCDDNVKLQNKPLKIYRYAYKEALRALGRPGKGSHAGFGNESVLSTPSLLSKSRATSRRAPPLAPRSSVDSLATPPSSSKRDSSFTSCISRFFSNLGRPLIFFVGSDALSDSGRWALLTMATAAFLSKALLRPRTFLARPGFQSLSCSAVGGGECPCSRWYRSPF